MTLDITSFKKAVDSLEVAIDEYAACQEASTTQKELMRDGIIQRFEYTFELSWKMLKRYIEMYGLDKPDTFTNKQLFRVGHEQGLIADPELWFKYLKSRNLTSHTYDENVADEVFEHALQFLKQAQDLLAKLKDKI